MKKDLQIVKQRLISLLSSGYYTGAVRPLPQAHIIAGSVADTLCWDDVDYSEKPAASYGANIHLNRMLEAICYEGVERLRDDEDWRNILIKLLRYWLRNDFCSTGWFHNQIGNPMLLANLMLLMESWIPEDLKPIMLERISRGSLRLPPIERQTYVKRRHPTEWTGGNLMWGAATTIKHAVLTEDGDLMQQAVAWIGTALCYSEEGVQPDGGFLQHGPRWYSCGYGAAFTLELAPLVYCVQDTPYAFPDEQLEVLFCHILEGQRRMQHRGYYDYGAIGRQLVRPANVHCGRMVKAIALLADIPTIPKRAELMEYLQELRDGTCYDKGTKYYESICLMQHSSKDGYISIRGSRGDIYGAEKTNNEGWLCYNMSYGTYTCFMRSGKEYFDIAPVWDYAKVPGTTARQENDEELKNHGDWDVLFRKENVCRGVVQDGKGILHQIVSHDGLSLKLACFVFDGCMVALGADILDADPTLGEVVTTVEQSRACGAKVISAGEMVNSGWCYQNLDPTTRFVCKIGTATGAWSRNNPASSEEPVTQDVFLLTVPIGKENHSYAYSVMPEECRCPIDVVQNDAVCQAVLVNRSVLMAVCYQDVEIDIHGSRIQLKAGEIKTINIIGT